MTFDITDKDIEMIKKGPLQSIKPLRFQVFPAKEKRKFILACFLVHVFEEDSIYTESDINHILGKVYDDFATVRRFLIDYQFLKRTNDCQSYWLNVKHKDYLRFK